MNKLEEFNRLLEEEIRKSSEKMKPLEESRLKRIKEAGEKIKELGYKKASIKKLIKKFPENNYSYLEMYEELNSKQKGLNVVRKAIKNEIDFANGGGEVYFTGLVTKGRKISRKRLSNSNNKALSIIKGELKYINEIQKNPFYELESDAKQRGFEIQRLKLKYYEKKLTDEDYFESEQSMEEFLLENGVDIKQYKDSNPAIFFEVTRNTITLF